MAVNPKKKKLYKHTIPQLNDNAHEQKKNVVIFSM